jgi:D-xylose 1-dehydrogenase
MNNAPNERAKIAEVVPEKKASVSDVIYRSLSKKRVVITGGGSGIGAIMVEAFARQGAQVFFLDIERDASIALAARLRDEPIPPKFYYCDLTKLDSLATTLGEIEQSAGSVEILINNAANDTRHSVQSVTLDNWDQSIAVNVRVQASSLTWALFLGIALSLT